MGHPDITLRVIGSQWYWSYEYPLEDSNFFISNGSESLVFESYMIQEEDLVFGHLRLLETDELVVLPVRTHIRVLVTSSDVLHSWAVPSLGIKLDACPGRLNRVPLYISREGVYYGQCSEICGILHGFMPIAVQGVNVRGFSTWLKFLDSHAG
jgi:cytochrome c oxidase subunit 2